MSNIVKYQQFNMIQAYTYKHMYRVCGRGASLPLYLMVDRKQTARQEGVKDKIHHGPSYSDLLPLWRSYLLKVPESLNYNTTSWKPNLQYMRPWGNIVHSNHNNYYCCYYFYHCHFHYSSIIIFVLLWAKMLEFK
jgi:hypothetical protein